MTPTSSLGFSMAAPSSGVMPNSTETPRFQLPLEWQHMRNLIEIDRFAFYLHQ